MAEKKKKTCSGCKESLPMTQFYNNKTNDDGKSIYCKECTKLNAKKYYQKKLLKLASKSSGITIKDDILPSNLVSLGERKTELALKLAVIQRLMLTVNSEVRELATYLNEEPMTMNNHKDVMTEVRTHPKADVVTKIEPSPKAESIAKAKVTPKAQAFSKAKVLSKTKTPTPIPLPARRGRKQKVA